MDNIEVMRILIYRGPRDKVEENIARSINGVKKFGEVTLTAVSLDIFPKIIEVIENGKLNEY